MTEHADAPEEDETQKWHCEPSADGGALLYTLRQDGWRRGQPVLVNDITVRISPENRSTTDPQPVIDKILAALNS